MSIKRIAIACFFIGALLFQFTGKEFIFHCQRFSIRKEIKRKIKRGVPAGELHRIAFAIGSKKPQELQWHNEHEFRLNENMYDIVSTEYGQDSVIYHCIDDQQETSLFAKLDSLVKDQWNSKPHLAQVHLLKLAFGSHYLPNKAYESTVLESKDQSSQTPYSFALKGWFKCPDAPPPRPFCFS